jgi:hypothetical protein
MTVTTARQTVPAAKLTGLHDPILQELWDIKAKLNAQAHYSVEEIVARLEDRKNQWKLKAAENKLH